MCHNENGEGPRNSAGEILFPPLWGDESFNVGVGIAQTFTTAAFVKCNIPIGFQERFPFGQGDLSDQNAVDIAEYFSRQPRPDFPDKIKDWLKGKRPLDACY